MVHGGGEREVAPREPSAAGEQHVTGAKVESFDPNVASSAGGPRDRHLIADAGRVLLNDNRVRAGWHDTAREDAHRLTWPDGLLERSAGSDFADHPEVGRNAYHIGSADSVAIHGGDRCGRLSAQCFDVVGKDAPVRVDQTSLDRRQRACIGKHAGQCVRNAEHSGLLRLEMP